MKKYLALHADQRLFKFNNYISEYDYVLVIPAYNENEDFIANLLKLAKNSQESILVIIIINSPENSCAHINNIFINNIFNYASCEYFSPELKILNLSSKISLALCGPYIMPAKQGVGRARKLGADWALSLINAQKISCPLIFSTDADALLPCNYFQAAKQSLKTDCAALVFPFKHISPEDKAHNEAIKLYEQRLAHYVQGLAYAGSPYAFHTLGSALAINAQSYAAVRGFPTRAAGEDFYILNKLRKIGEINLVACDPILLSARVSERVPFGTGPALSSLLENNLDKKIFYHPGVFEELKKLLILAEKQIIKVPQFMNQEALLRALAGPKKLEDKIKAFHCWFDGFMTLKFIHGLRDRGFAMCSKSELEKIAHVYKI